MHLYIKKIEVRDCTPEGILITHDVVKFFFNPEFAFFNGTQTRVSYPFAHLRNVQEIRNIDIKRANGNFYIDTNIVALLQHNAETIDLGDLLYIEQVEVTYIVKLIKNGGQNFDIFNNLLNENDRHFLLLSEEGMNEDQNQTNRCIINCKQIIYYGVPGCGKSNKIKEDLQDVPNDQKIRVVFHPEYTNADFIGQILPVVNHGVSYAFTAGPLAQIIKRAYLNPEKKFYLIIEEINRGNAAAIFGDTFQLLDRLKVGETDSLGNDPTNVNVNTFTEGWSQYFVQNNDINAYIRKVDLDANNHYVERDDGNPREDIQIGNIRFNKDTAIRLPPNLSILATMNTSDQNVFTLDNAFQRRFDMELIRNEFEKGDNHNQFGGFKTEKIQRQFDSLIADTTIKWGVFLEKINDKIVHTLKGLSSTEDKRLGVWFVSNVDGTIGKKVFAEKVLKYLWDDVFKFKRPQVFAKDIDTLEKLIETYETNVGVARFNVFKEPTFFLRQNPEPPVNMNVDQEPAAENLVGADA